MKPLRYAAIALCTVLALLVCSLILPTFARYSNTASTAVLFGDDTDLLMGNTLSAATEVYDFGVYTRDTDLAEFTHTLRIVQPSSVSGVMRFSWDDTTRANKDIAVYVDSGYYITVQNSGYTDYTVSAADGVLEIPFSLMFSDPAVDRTAELNVSWYPDGTDEPTLFARYLLGVSASDAVGTVPTFVEENTSFIAQHLLQAEVTTSADYAGVLLSPSDGVFAAGTHYCHTTCPNGATLLRDSALFIPREEDSSRVYLDLSAHLTDNSPISLRVGVTDTVYSDITCTPSSVAALTVKLSHNAAVLSADQPLVVTLTEAVALKDGDWSQAGDTPADLQWQIFRREGDAFYPVTVGEKLTVTVSQQEDSGTLTVSVPDGAQPAGTYVLVVTQYYDGYPVLKTPVWFFIDYR